MGRPVAAAPSPAAGEPETAGAVTPETPVSGAPSLESLESMESLKSPEPLEPR
jgi:hypothetical protein